MYVKILRCKDYEKLLEYKKENKPQKMEIEKKPSNVYDHNNKDWRDKTGIT